MIMSISSLISRYLTASTRRLFLVVLIPGAVLEQSASGFTPQLIDIDFGSGGARGYSLKTGFAAIGQATNDFWNFYDRDISSTPYNWRSSGTLVNLKSANGVTTAVGVSVSDAPGAWNDSSSDPMYETYIYPLDGGDNVVTFTNLPPGQYDLLAYSPDGNYEVTVGGTSYGIKTTYDNPVSSVPVWMEGVQYARWSNIEVGAGQSLVLASHPNTQGLECISGVQILSSIPLPPPTPPPPLTNGTLLDVDFGAGPINGGVSAKTGFAAIGQNTNDFWNYYTRDNGSGGYRTFGADPNLKTASGAVSAVGLTVSDAPGAWGNGSSDPMYATYLYSFDGGSPAVTLTNLPVGQYDLYLYSSDGNFDVSVGGTDYGVKMARDLTLVNPPVWQAGVQYAHFTNLSVNAGQDVVISVQPGTAYPGAISGLQILLNSSPPPTVLNMTPPIWYVNEGATVTYTVTAVGSPTLAYQWQYNGSAITDATNATLTLTNVIYAQAGNYAVVVSNPGGMVTSSNVVLRVNRPPVADASATAALTISPNGTNAVVVLNGSRSSDPDGDALTYAWYLTGNATPMATGIVTLETLPVGKNALTLTVNDGMSLGSQTFAVVVITTSESIDRLIHLVRFGAGNSQPLVAFLKAALASIERGQPQTAIKKLEAFIKKIQAQLAPADPVLAAQLIADAQAIIDALNGGTNVTAAPVVITAFSHGPHGKSHLKITGIAGRVPVIETSTNMVDWVKVGVATQAADGSYEFDDSSAEQSGTRFYRVVSP